MTEKLNQRERIERVRERGRRGRVREREGGGEGVLSGARGGRDGGRRGGTKAAVAEKGAPKEEETRRRMEHEQGRRRGCSGEREM